MDVTPASLSLWTPLTGISLLIPKGTILPTRKEILLEQRDRDHRIHFIVVHGENPKLGNNKPLGNFALDPLPPAAPDRRHPDMHINPQCNVRFEIDANGMLNVTAFQGKWLSKQHEISIHLTIWPAEVIDWLCTEFEKGEGIDLRQDTMAYQRIAEAASEAKIKLSTAIETEINLPFITADASGPKHLLMTLSQAKWEQLTGAPFRTKPKKPDYKSLIESPIEEMFWEAAQGKLKLVPQVHIGRYRVDFAIPAQKVAIELDGHDYHKSKEQRTNDASRERWIERQGWRVIRFTGSEVYRNAAKCVAETLAFLNA